MEERIQKLERENLRLQQQISLLMAKIAELEYVEEPNPYEYRCYNCHKRCGWYGVCSKCESK